MGTFSKEWMYLNCNVRHHCLGVKLLRPIIFRGQSVNRLFITEIVDNEFKRSLCNKTGIIQEDTLGTLQVQAFSQRPSDSQLIEIDMDNIDTISTIQ